MAEMTGGGEVRKEWGERKLNRDSPLVLWPGPLPEVFCAETEIKKREGEK